MGEDREVKAGPQLYFKMTYKKGLFEKISKIFTNNFRVALKDRDCRVNLSGKSNTNLGGLFSNLDKLEITKKCNVVYRIPCKDCDKAYIGKTTQFLEKRLYQHGYNIRKKDNKTALCQHSVNLNHSFDFENVSVLVGEKNDEILRILEMYYIISEESSLVNNQTDSEDLSAVYYNVLFY